MYAAYTAARHPASYRDPAGFVFTADGVLYRQINEAGRADYERLRTSGLYDLLTAAGDLIPHEEVDNALSVDGRAYRVIRPERIDFVSYPFEWCFSQLKDAALLTLRAQKAALSRGLSLKDASAFNVTFHRGRPVLLDTLSFEVHEADRPWVAYRQFCEMFLAPLVLMADVDVRLLQLLRTSLDGIPLTLAKTLMPWRSRLRPGRFIHLYMHATAERMLADRAPGRPRRPVGANSVPALVDSLERTVRSLDWRPEGTTWGDYYSATNYTDASLEHKREIVRAALAETQPGRVWDLGANDGTFSRVASAQGIPTVACDIDPAAVEKNYRRLVAERDTNILPLLLDLTNPSPACGWAGRERDAFTARGRADLVLALALVHHLAIAHNVPLEQIAEFLAGIARAVLIEFVPKEDSQVQRMLASRQDVFPDFTQQGFERACAPHFTIERVTAVRDTRRTLYLLRRRDV